MDVMIVGQPSWLPFRGPAVTLAFPRSQTTLKLSLAHSQLRWCDGICVHLCDLWASLRCRDDFATFAPSRFKPATVRWLDPRLIVPGLFLLPPAPAESVRMQLFELLGELVPRSEKWQWPGRFVRLAHLDRC